MPNPKRGPQRPLTPNDLRDALAVNSREVLNQVNADLASVRKEIGSVREEVQSLREEMHEGFHQVDIKLDAVMELLATRKQLHNLVRELRAQGLTLDEARIFAA